MPPKRTLRTHQIREAFVKEVVEMFGLEFKEYMDREQDDWQHWVDSIPVEDAKKKVFAVRQEREKVRVKEERKRKMAAEFVRLAKQREEEIAEEEAEQRRVELHAEQATRGAELAERLRVEQATRDAEQAKLDAEQVKLDAEQKAVEDAAQDVEDAAQAARDAAWKAKDVTEDKAWAESETRDVIRDYMDEVNRYNGDRSWDEFSSQQVSDKRNELLNKAEQIEELIAGNDKVKDIPRFTPSMRWRKQLILASEDPKITTWTGAAMLTGRRTIAVKYVENQLGFRISNTGRVTEVTEAAEAAGVKKKWVVVEIGANARWLHAVRGIDEITTAIKELKRDYTDIDTVIITFEIGGAADVQKLQPLPAPARQRASMFERLLDGDQAGYRLDVRGLFIPPIERPMGVYTGSLQQYLVGPDDERTTMWPNGWQLLWTKLPIDKTTRCYYAKDYSNKREWNKPQDIINFEYGVKLLNALNVPGSPRGDSDAVIDVLDKGATPIQKLVDEKGTYYGNALHIAASYGNDDICSLLLDNDVGGINLPMEGAPDPNTTALYLAVKNDNNITDRQRFAVVRLLLTYGADIADVVKDIARNRKYADISALLNLSSEHYNLLRMAPVDWLHKQIQDQLSRTGSTDIPLLLRSARGAQHAVPMPAKTKAVQVDGGGRRKYRKSKRTKKRKYRKSKRTKKRKSKRTKKRKSKRR